MPISSMKQQIPNIILLQTAMRSHRGLNTALSSILNVISGMSALKVHYQPHATPTASFSRVTSLLTREAKKYSHDFGTYQSQELSSK